MAHSKSLYLHGLCPELWLQGMEGLSGNLAAAGADVCTAQCEDMVLPFTSLVCSLW